MTRFGSRLRERAASPNLGFTETFRGKVTLVGLGTTFVEKRMG